MLQKTFGIYSEVEGESKLFIEAGLQHVACWCKEYNTGKITGFEFFQFDAEDGNDIENVLHNVLLQSKLAVAPAEAVAITWENPDAVCVPAIFYKDEFAGYYLDLVAGESQGTAPVQAYYTGKQVIICRLRADYINSFNKHFKNAKSAHKFHVLLEKYFNQAQRQVNTLVYTVFYPMHFILTIVKEGELQLIRSISYSTSEDVLYCIMQVCQLHNLPPGTTPVIASGLIDTASNLYNTLYAYLENFVLEQPVNTVFADSFAEYPYHYFLPFIYE
ncbi:MAG TPA: DUF3822 family protein [Chitinophagaceae bacterium]|jgi:hypothetical protein|nr:DUF3822 family protein [Chitinophagaceae bacterium]